MHRRTLLQAIAATAASAGLGLRPGGALAAGRIEPLTEEGGVYSQQWFLQSFLELAEDLEDAAAADKRFAIIWEQPGCPYCRDLHVINLGDPDVNAWIAERFEILQLTLGGNREVTDFDGEVISERRLARKYRVNFTPTLQFFPRTLAEFEGKPAADAEIIRMPGYFRPFHFISIFEFIHYERYRDIDFQGYLAERGAKAREAGIDLGKPLPM